MKGSEYCTSDTTMVITDVSISQDHDNQQISVIHSEWCEQNNDIDKVAENDDKNDELDTEDENHDDSVCSPHLAAT